MKKRQMGSLLLMILTAFLLAGAAMAEEAAGPEWEETAAEEPVELIGEGTAELFQCGSLTGAYTQPDEISLFATGTPYDQLYDGLQKRLSSITISLAYSSQADLVAKLAPIFEKVVNDHPELFFVRNRYDYSYNKNGGNSTQVFPVYLPVSENDIAVFNAKSDQIAAQAPNKGALEQMLWVHDYLAVNCAYNWEVATTGSTNNEKVYSAYGALVDGDAVCQGYALAYKLILDKLGLECVTVTSRSMNHMWNLVKLGNDWYHMDVTSDDPVPDTQGYAGHTYFLLSDAAIGTAVPYKRNAHYGWETSVECTNTKFETGYIFNDIKYPIHFWDGGCYYLSGTGNSGDIYRSNSLETKDAVKITANALSLFMHRVPAEDNKYYVCAVNGAVWLNDTLFYVNEAKEVMGYSLTSGRSISLGTVPFTANPSSDNKYEQTRDGIGLRYDGIMKEIVAQSPTQRRELGRYTIGEIPSYPEAWDGALPGTRLLGLTDDLKMAGVMDGGGLTLWAAYYRNGRMLSVGSYFISGGGLQVVTLDAAPAGCDNIRLMLTGFGYAPACEAFPAA